MSLVPRLPIAAPRQWSLAGRLFALQAGMVLLIVAAAFGAAYRQAAATNSDAAGDRVLAVARSVAATPAVRTAVTGPDPTATLQPLAEAVRLETGTDFVVIMSVDGIRYTHPNPAEIGGHFLGHTAPAVQGHAFTETYTGTLGRSIRAVVPVTDGGQVRALVSVGVKVAGVSQNLQRQVPLLLGAAGTALLLAWLGSWLASRWLRRSTHDLGPAELSRMYEFYDAVLHTVREGLLLLDRAGRVQLANDEARRLLGIPPDAIGRRVDQLGLPDPLGEALATGRDRADELHLAGDRVLVLNQVRTRWHGKDLGSVVTMRDHTELRALTSELDSIRGLAESLHAQTHEAANQLHTVISLIELGRPTDALEYATGELAVAQHLTDRVVAAVEEPVLAALLIGKGAEAGERGVELTIADDLWVPAGVVDPRDLVTIAGNLLDNAIDAAAAAPAPRWVSFGAGHTGDELVLRVADSGAGLDPAGVQRAFQRGWSTKDVPGSAGGGTRQAGRGLGLALVAQAVHRYGGRTEVTRERGAVFTVYLPARVPAAVAPQGVR